MSDEVFLDELRGGETGGGIADTQVIDIVHAATGDTQQLAQEIVARPVEGRLEDELRILLVIENEEAAEMQALDGVEAEPGFALQGPVGGDGRRVGVPAQIGPALLDALGDQRRYDGRVGRRHGCTCHGLKVRTSLHGTGPS